jgi:hypothetical protein
MVGGLGTPSSLVLVKVGVGWPSTFCPYSWRSHKQRQQLAKVRTAELGGFDRDQRHGDGSVSLDCPTGLEPGASSQGESLPLKSSGPTSAIHHPPT